MRELAQQIEAILFLAGEGFSVKSLAEKLFIHTECVVKALREVNDKYNNDESGIHLIKYKDSYQFATSPEVAEVVAGVLNPVREKNLTRAALETMAIVAYKQPVTKLEIDEIRGVSSDYSVHLLMQNNLIEVVGRKDSLGKPLLYGTTDDFLKRFELDNIENLPSYDDLLNKLKTIETNFDLYARTEA
jgi:segregation and condensation protein B